MTSQTFENNNHLIQLSPGPTAEPVLLRIGDLAKKTGKTNRALRLYEEMGLLVPSDRTSGGFRLYHAANEERVFWITKLQDLGFTLPQIQELLATSQSPGVPKEAEALRGEFQERLDLLQAQMARLSQLKTELGEALDYLAGCTSCDHVQNAPKTQDVCSCCGRTEDFPSLLNNLWQRSES